MQINTLFKSSVCFIWESVLRRVLCVCLEVCKKFKQSLSNFEHWNCQYFKQLWGLGPYQSCLYTKKCISLMPVEHVDILFKWKKIFVHRSKFNIIIFFLICKTFLDTFIKIIKEQENIYFSLHFLNKKRFFYLFILFTYGWNLTTPRHILAPAVCTPNSCRRTWNFCSW